MSKWVWLALVAACGTDVQATVDDAAAGRQSFSFGPFTIPPSAEISDQCVQITLHNSDYLYVNQVELTTGPGFHHSNWFFVPAGDPATGALATFPGDDGTFRCADRSFDQAVAAFRGGVLFAQSTQSVHDVQAFAPGVVLKIPPHSKLVSTIHLLNPSDGVLDLTPTIALTSIAAAAVTTTLAGMSFEDHALGLPPQKQSSFQVDCDLQPTWQNLYNASQVALPQPDFKLYYALAHYHALGTGMTIEAVRPDRTATTIYSTAMKIGDSLGAPLEPVFDMTGYTHLRFTCDYFNNTDATVGWGIGNQEMCVFLAFSDSGYIWGGGDLTDGTPGPGTDVGGVTTFSSPCEVHASDASR